MRISHGAIALVSGLALTACVANPPYQTGTDTALSGGEWLVEDIGGRGVIDRSQTTLTFDENGRLTGNTSCNNYFADYQTAGAILEIGAAGATKRACPPAVMDQESRFLSLLNDVKSYEINDTGTLILFTSNGDAITARQAVAAQTSYRCTDGSVVRASYPTTETARVTYEDRTVDMNIAVSASGSRYVGGDLQWWTKGMKKGLIAPLASGEAMTSATGLTCTAD